MDISCQPSTTYKCHSILRYHAWLVQFNQPCDFTQKIPLHAQNVTQAYTSIHKQRFFPLWIPKWTWDNPKTSQNIQGIWNPKAVRWCMRYLHWGLPRRGSGAPLAPPAVPTPPAPRVWGSRPARSAPHPVAVPLSAGMNFQDPVTTDHNRMATELQQNATDEQVSEQIWQRCFTEHLFRLPTSNTSNIQHGCMNCWKPAAQNQLFF